jgi:hypothetical protein
MAMTAWAAKFVITLGKPLSVGKLQYRRAGLSRCKFSACFLVQVREPATGIIMIEIPAGLDGADKSTILPA